MKAYLVMVKNEDDLEKCVGVYEEIVNAVQCADKLKQQGYQDIRVKMFDEE